MDGVLVDSEPFICRAAIMMFKELGVTVFPEDFIPFVGMGENRYLGGALEFVCLPVTTSFDASALKEADWICESLLEASEEVLEW